MNYSPEEFAKELSFFKSDAVIAPTAFFDELNCSTKASSQRGLMLPFGPVEYVVRKAQAEYKMFENVCRHRGMRLHSEHILNGRTICPYHSWCYDNSGAVQNKSLNAQIPSTTLRGQEGLITMSDGLGVHDLYPKMTLKNTFYVGSMLHQCNWKLIVDNVLEAYHINSVHRESFRKIGYSGSAYSSVKNLERSSSAVLGKNSGGKGEFAHQYIWPNFFASNTDNLIIYNSFVFPINEATTLKIFYLGDGSRMARLSAAAQGQVRSQAKAFTEQVLKEDRQILEEQQRSVLSLGDPLLDPESECRLIWFRNLWGSSIAE